MSTLPTGTITFLFSDLEGSAQLWELHPDAMRADLARHDALLRTEIGQNGGHVFKTVGDAFCAAFATAPQGLAAALGAQRSLHAAPWTVPDPGLRARLALHTGEAQERDGDYFGPTLNRVARLRDAAHGGQTILSQATEQLVRDAMPDGAWLRDLGPHRLKDLSRPEQIFQIHHPDLPGDFPALRSLDRVPNNLPQRLDSFVGREDELARVKRMLIAARMLTLTGVGGAGKTRLAQQAAAESLDHFPDGVWLVALEALTDPSLVPQAAAAACGVREQPGRPLTAVLCEALRERQMLLLLDNCEHLIEACARFAQTVLQACPHVQILATSREPLSIGGEATAAVPPMLLTPRTRGDRAEFPEEVSEAVHLFADRAALSLPSFTLTPQNAPVIARICRQLDSLPLAIELAAPRVKTLTPEQISQRLNQRFRLLTGGSRTALPRQQTMQATIQWSHDLLSEPERGLFRRLSVFVGGWTLEAAEQVCSGEGLDEWGVMDLLSSLVAKSLVQSDEDGGGDHRYRMLETLRQYSAERLDDDPAGKGTQEKHLRHYLALAAQAEPEIRGPRQNLWLHRLEREHDNFRAALTWADPESRLRLATLLHRFWYIHGHLSEGRRWLQDAALTLPHLSPSVQAQALNAAGVLAWYQTDNEAALAFHSRALAIYQERGERQGIARTLINLGILCDGRQDYDQALRCFSEGLEIYRQLGVMQDVARALINLASHFIHRGVYDSALPCLQESLSLLRLAEDGWPLAIVYYNFGTIALGRSDSQGACDWFAKCLTIRKELGDPLGIAACLLPLAHAVRVQGEPGLAVTLLGAADAVYLSVRASPQAVDVQKTAALLATLRQETESAEYMAAWDYGKSLDADSAADYTLRTLRQGRDEKEP